MSDLISREALKKAFENLASDDYNEPIWYQQTVFETIDNAPTVEQPTGEWIPVKYRPMTDEDREEYNDAFGAEYLFEDDDLVFDCPMPEDGQEILVSSSWGVRIDVAENDSAGGFNAYGLEENGDWEGIEAWMPLPESYKKGGEEND